MSNPKLAVESILEDEKTVNEYQIYPLSIGRYALLELVESPFIDSTKPFSTINIVPGLYIMTHPIEDLKGYTRKNADELVAKAMEWQEDVDIGMMGDIVQDIIEKVRTTFKMSPATGGASKGETSDGKKN